MSEVKIVLDRKDKTKSGVWVDGVKLKFVKDVTVYGSATDLPQVVVTMMPEVVTIDAYEPQLDTNDNEKN